jgi:hypothetical protein
VDGLAWALWIGAAMVGLGAVAALGIPGRQATPAAPPGTTPQAGTGAAAASDHPRPLVPAGGRGAQWR